MLLDELFELLGVVEDFLDGFFVLAN